MPEKFIYKAKQNKAKNPQKLELQVRINKYQ